MIAIHKARIEEVLEIKRVLSETWTDTYVGIYSQEAIDYITSKWHTPENLTMQINNPDIYFGIAKDNGQMIGLVTARKLDNHTIMMQRLYIKSSYHRQGIGTQLILEAIKSFPQTTKLKLEVEEQNKKALAFYKKCGFKETRRKEEKVGEYTMPTIEMEKDI